MYEVQRDGVTIEDAVVPPGTGGYFDCDAQEGTHAYRVRAKDLSGFASAYTQPVNVTVVGGCE